MEELIKALMTFLSVVFVISVLVCMARDMRRQEEEDPTRLTKCEWCGHYEPCTRRDCPLVQ